MSTQRRRVLENGGLVIPADGVYIEGLDGRAYTVNKWQGGSAANSVIVASGDVKFRIALDYETLALGKNSARFDKYVTGTTSSATALSDYDGAGNTAKMLLAQSGTDYAAGYCSNFTFPDGKTKGYLPSLGQLNVVYKNKAPVNAALKACGASFSMSNYNWSSTLRGYSGGYTSYWVYYLTKGTVISSDLDIVRFVHPFADIS